MVRQFWASVCLWVCVIFVPLGHAGIGDSEHPLAVAITSINADVVFMRHALAPGTGDPVHFDVDDCNTQRNLDDVGRAQARRIGDDLRTASIAFDRVMTSPWCRCRETTRLMALGEPIVSWGLASFYDGHVNRTETLALLRAGLAKRRQGLTMMVTHQVVISAITGLYTRSGAMVAYNSQTGQALAVPLQ